MTDDPAMAIALHINTFLKNLTDEQVAALLDGTAELTLVEVDNPDADRSPAGCACPCRHQFGCLTCSCTCDPVGPTGRRCRCCGADDDALIEGRAA